MLGGIPPGKPCIFGPFVVLRTLQKPALSGFLVGEAPQAVFPAQQALARAQEAWKPQKESLA